MYRGPLAAAIKPIGSCSSALAGDAPRRQQRHTSSRAGGSSSSGRVVAVRRLGVAGEGHTDEELEGIKRLAQWYAIHQHPAAGQSMGAAG